MTNYESRLVLSQHIPRQDTTDTMEHGKTTPTKCVLSHCRATLLVADDLGTYWFADSVYSGFDFKIVVRSVSLINNK